MIVKVYVENVFNNFKNIKERKQESISVYSQNEVVGVFEELSNYKVFI